MSFIIQRYETNVNTLTGIDISAMPVAKNYACLKRRAA